MDHTQQAGISGGGGSNSVQAPGRSTRWKKTAQPKTAGTARKRTSQNR